MKNTKTLPYLFSIVSAFCEKNNLRFPTGRGRRPLLDFPALLTLLIYWQVAQVKNFKAFYHGPVRVILREFFPRLPEYSALMRRFPRALGVLQSHFAARKRSGKYIIDSTPFEVCKMHRHRRYRSMPEAIGRIVCRKVTRMYGFKAHLLTDIAGNQALRVHFSSGTAHDVNFMENLLRDCTGVGIGDTCYVSSARQKALSEKGLTFIARRRANMRVQNSPAEMALLKQRHRIEIFVGKLKRLVGESFSRFRSWSAAQATILVGVVAINLGL